MYYKVNINLSYSHKYNPIRYWYPRINKTSKPKFREISRLVQF